MDNIGIENIIFLIVAVVGIGLFVWQIRKIRKNVLMGRDMVIADNPKERINQTLLVAFGQQKMFKRMVPAVLHLFVYVGFIVINIEVLEILIDGIFGTHRVLGFVGVLYSGLTALNEILAALVIFACAAFLWRRNVMKLPRLASGVEMRAWPELDANIILVTEIVLMLALFAFNIADLRQVQLAGEEVVGAYPISQLFVNVFGGNPTTLLVIEKVGWWVHILGILAFMNYLPSSKHFHIIMAFPNVYYAKLLPKGKFTTNPAITNEIKAMLDPSYQPPAPETDADGNPIIQRFGAKDVEDLTWKQIMDSYTCTECGRCTAVCPGNITGKLLSPRKVVMDTRDRVEEKGERPAIFAPNHYKELGVDRVPVTEEKTLLRGYVTPEELWACTTCNACVEACPVGIDQLSTIMDLRRFLVLEESAAPASLNAMFTNIENNGAPWAFSPADRFNWADELYVPSKS
ncbi:4Fe-4S dicluster protein [Pontibacter ummariensis]|uniref:4Fe-4S dicluster domain-containing protein n=1 Tax=Pontibacter ummariensis TaxID=1610492 RepID=A0A239GS93_9BACT|nr:(Fe-S)-binding protein [Pontibacter ummariensis]PRY11046.1 4Fe-4S dicluster protein [Pontibacter ummariensis]SNS72007.1 4Fe-4S dicluster domain-containing protein [Pontibacter ummariensis]